MLPKRLLTLNPVFKTSKLLPLRCKKLLPTSTLYNPSKWSRESKPSTKLNQPFMLMDPTANKLTKKNKFGSNRSKMLSPSAQIENKDSSTLSRTSLKSDKTLLTLRPIWEPMIWLPDKKLETSSLFTFMDPNLLPWDSLKSLLLLPTKKTLLLDSSLEWKPLTTLSTDYPASKLSKMISPRSKTLFKRSNPKTLSSLWKPLKNSSKFTKDYGPLIPIASKPLLKEKPGSKPSKPLSLTETTPNKESPTYSKTLNKSSEILKPSNNSKETTISLLETNSVTSLPSTFTESSLLN